MPIGAYDATPSWSGYQYQGKVALYHVLRVINEKLSNEPNYSFDKYSLEIEWMEDFAIMNNGLYESIHQVKAYDECSPSNYKSAIVEILFKLFTRSIPKGFLHLRQTIKFSRKIYDFKKMKQTYNPKKYSSNILDRLEIYRYGDKNFCELDEIDLLIIDEIKKYYDNKPINLDVDIEKTEKQCEGVRLALCNLLDKHIIKRHQNYSNTNGKYTIPFEKIIDVFAVNYEASSEAYNQVTLMNRLYECFYEFCADTSACIKKTCDVCKLKRTIKMLDDHSSEEVWEIIEKASPHMHSKKTDLSSLWERTGIFESLYDCFYQIDINKKTDASNVLKYKANNNEIMLPTAIHGSRTGTIAKRILDNPNPNTLENLYDVDCMISRDVEINNLGEAVAHIRVLKDKDVKNYTKSKNDYNREDSEHIAKIRVKKVSKLEEVLGELK